MKKKNQLLLIHGGNTFKNKKDYMNFLKTCEISIEKKVRWSGEYLDKKLDRDFKIIKPRMPLSENAKYKEWKIYFERYSPYLRNNLILIGVSLGGIFLAKYLSENKFPKKILSTYLVSPPFDDDLTSERLAGGFKLKSDLSMIEKNSKKISLLFSEDDEVVPISHAKKYRKKLRNANIIIYESKNGHFRVAKFPEIVRMIKNDIKANKV